MLEKVETRSAVLPPVTIWMLNSGWRSSYQRRRYRHLLAVLPFLTLHRRAHRHPAAGPGQNDGWGILWHMPLRPFWLGRPVAGSPTADSRAARSAQVAGPGTLPPVSS